MELSCLLGIRALSCKENLSCFLRFIPYNKSLIDQACLVKMAGYWTNPVPLLDLYFDLFSYPVASIVFGDLAIVSLFLLLFFQPIPDPVWKVTCSLGYWPRSFFVCLLTFVSAHKHAKKELGQYPAILTSHMVNNPYMFVCL